MIYKPVEPVAKSEVKAPVGDTSQGGHYHGDEWHTDPHAAVEVSEAEVSSDGQGVPDVLAAPVVAEPANTQIDAATLKSAGRRWNGLEVSKAWLEWSEKAKELRRKHMQAAGEKIALLPKTAEELERFDNDPEWQRRHNEAFQKTAKLYSQNKSNVV